MIFSGNSFLHNQIPHLQCKEIVCVLDSVVWKLNTDMIRSGKHMLNSLFTLLLRTERSFQFKSWMYTLLAGNFFYFYFFVMYTFIVLQPKCVPTAFSLDQKVFVYFFYEKRWVYPLLNDLLIVFNRFLIVQISEKPVCNLLFIIILIIICSGQTFSLSISLDK